jgi:hypothetical protein
MAGVLCAVVADGDVGRGEARGDRLLYAVCPVRHAIRCRLSCA